jgi:hypothetical protein
MTLVGLFGTSPIVVLILSHCHTSSRRFVRVLPCALIGINYPCLAIIMMEETATMTIMNSASVVSDTGADEVKNNTTTKKKKVGFSADTVDNSSKKRQRCASEDRSSSSSSDSAPSCKTQKTSSCGQHPCCKRLQQDVHAAGYHLKILADFLKQEREVLKGPEEAIAKFYEPDRGDVALIAEWRRSGARVYAVMREKCRRLEEMEAKFGSYQENFGA